MTTKVVKGSLWTLAGQVLPLFVSLVTTPFVIRFLGAEGYGIIILIGLIPSYFSFADFGMGYGSTKFSSEAYARGARDEEGKVVRTAALIAFLTSFPIAVGIFSLSFYIVDWFKIPEHLHSEASAALKIASITFVLNLLSGIFNTPQLSRLRMDLNTLITAGFRIAGIIAVPVVLFSGGGILGAVWALMIAGFLSLLGHIFVSSRLLKELLHFSISREIVKPLLKFGSGLAVSGIAAILLANLEKVVLARAASVETLAYYSVAYTFASMATMFSSSMIQSLIPAFSQLLGPEKKEELNRLFSRGLRINIIGMLPIILFLFVIAKPFFSIWAGENFGRESSNPFYILLLGLFFNLIAYIPYSILIASGRTDVLAKIYWIELFPYILLTMVLTGKFGAVGAALAWSLRVFFDTLIFVWLSIKILGVSYNLFDQKRLVFMVSFLILSPPVLIAGLINNYSIWLIFLTPVCVLIYYFIAWKNFLESGEKNWISSKVYALINR